jgi:hypothetical protein
VRSKAPASANRVVTLTTVTASETRIPGEAPGSRLAAVPRFASGFEERDKGGCRAAKAGVGDLGFQQWRALGALAAVGFIVILASVYGGPLFSSTVQMWNPRTSTANRACREQHQTTRSRIHLQLSPLLVSPAAAWLPNAEKPKRWSHLRRLSPALAPLDLHWRRSGPIHQRRQR